MNQQLTPATPATHPAINHPDLSSARLAFVVLVVALILWGSLASSLVAGMVFAIAFGHPYPKFGRKFTTWLFQGCVVLLGFGMDLEKVLRAGLSGALFAIVTIAATLAAGFWIGRLLGIGTNTSALIASGTAICGGSAIAAVGPVISATEAEMGIALGSIFLLNAAALIVFPIIGAGLHLTQHQFGVWAGIGIHDISSVVGAASVYGQEALQTATAVKLSRALWIVPLTIGMSAFLARRSPAKPHSPSAVLLQSDARNQPKAAAPWFIGFFGLASLLRSLFPPIAHCSPQIDPAAKAGMSIALCLIGASISPAVLRKLGWKVALQAILLWCFISVAALFIALNFA
ncbi:MAG: putative sulfate exporter family transporter [Verrucomicrobiota bacterium]